MLSNLLQCSPISSASKPGRSSLFKSINLNIIPKKIEQAHLVWLIIWDLSPLVPWTHRKSGKWTKNYWATVSSNHRKWKNKVFLIIISCYSSKSFWKAIVLLGGWPSSKLNWRETNKMKQKMRWMISGLPTTKELNKKSNSEILMKSN